MNVDIARSVRIIKQCNAIVFMQAVRVGELTNHSGYLNIMKTYEILMLLKLHGFGNGDAIYGKLHINIL